MTKKSFLIDVDKCSSCSLCIVACKDEHVDNSYPPWAAPQPDTGHFWIDLIKVERGKTPRVKMSYLPVMCQHCEDAPCMTACAEGAIKRRADGLIWVDPNLCNGCGRCQEACPYDVIYMNEELGIAQKCTGCAHRVDRGELPRCAEVCPHDAILFGDDTSPVFHQTSEQKIPEVFHPEFETKPRILWRGLPKPWIAGIVLDAVANEVIVGAEVTSVDLHDGVSMTVRSDEFGDFWIRELQVGRSYDVKVKKDGYDAFCATIVTDGDQDMGAVVLKKSG